MTMCHSLNAQNKTSTESVHILEQQKCICYDYASFSKSSMDLFILLLTVGCILTSRVKQPLVKNMPVFRKYYVPWGIYVHMYSSQHPLLFLLHQNCLHIKQCKFMEGLRKSCQESLVPS